MQAKISALSVHQDGGSRINTQTKTFDTRAGEVQFVALIVLSHRLITICFCVVLNEVMLTPPLAPRAQCCWFFYLILLYI